MAEPTALERWYFECVNADCGKPIDAGNIPADKESLPDARKHELTCPHCGHVASYEPSLARQHKDPYRD